MPTDLQLKTASKTKCIDECSEKVTQLTDSYSLGKMASVVESVEMIKETVALES